MTICVSGEQLPPGAHEARLKRFNALLDQLDPRLEKLRASPTTP